MQGLFRRAAASFVAVCLLVPQSPGASTASVRHGALRTTSVALASPPQRIAVKEPVRVKPVLPPLNAMRAKIVPGIRAHGVPVNGPPMLRPSEVDHARTAGRSRVVQSSTAQQLLPAGRTIPQPPSAGTRPGTRHTMSLPSDPSASGSGINPWWRYQEQNVPGGGHLMVNVGTGNLLLQDDDMTVPHKGIALAFRRTYNSQNSAASTPNYFGNWQSIYGNGWTSTFDAHFVKISASLVAIYDIDGARYDYAIPTGTTYSAGTTLPSATAGQHATLTFDGVCGWLWTKKTGTTYYFYGTNPTLSCPTLSGAVGGYAGRLRQIIGRNSNTYITFAYAWDNGNASTTGKISQITATTESGMTATLSFGDVNGRRLLQQITYPDNATYVSYGYDAQGNLGAVSRPPNNAQGTRPLQTFAYATIGTDSVLADIASPRYNAGCIAGACGSDGGALVIGYAGSSALSSTVSSIAHVAVVNPPISDGTGAPLQAGYSSSAYGFLTEYYGTGTTTPTFRDTDGHMTNWVFDGAGRPMQTQECRSSTNQGQQCASPTDWLSTNESWDTNNNLVSETDQRGNETDYAYDVHGNTVAAAAPQPAPGTFRPTRLFTYDAYDNLTAYCDPIATHSFTADWTSVPTAPVPGQGGLCPQSSVATQYQWLATTAESFGELTVVRSPANTFAPTGYTRSFSYDTGPQGGLDYGLPTRVLGGPITQNDSTTPTRQPQQAFWYDTAGNLVCYGTGSGQWLVAYDSLGRLTSSSDPDDSASGAGVCGKSGAQAGWNTTSRTAYFPDGSVSSKQTASQVANGVATTFTDDVDGNALTESHHYGCVSTSGCNIGTTQKIYDGADRLVEVLQPYDAWDVQSYSWATRYIYDLSQGGTSPYRGIGLAGYGNLVSTQELLSGAVWQPNLSATYSIATASWMDARSTAFDALDRSVATYEAAFGDQPKERRSYDGAGQAGLLSSVTLATNEQKHYTYDGIGRQTDVTYSGDGGVTPGMHLAYDAAGRVTSAGTDVLGAEAMQYDATGNLLSVTEPASLGGSIVSYDYYADGKRQDLKYSGGGYSYQPLLQYGYRNDGARDRLQLNNGTAFQWTYTAAGRELSQSDPLTGTTIHPDASYSISKNDRQAPYYPASMTYVPRVLTYDTFARLSHLGLPEAIGPSISYDYASSQYDLEDSPISETRNRYVASTTGSGTGGNNALAACLPTTIRNEKMPNAAAMACPSGPPTHLDYNGTVLPPVKTYDPHSTVAWTLDARAGMLLSAQYITPNGNLAGSAYVHDASGRLTQDTEGQEPLCPPGDPYVGPTSINACYSNGTRQKTYDAENRLRSDVYSYAGLAATAHTSYGGSLVGGFWTYNLYQPASIQSADYNAESHPVRLTLYHPEQSAGEIRAWLWDGNDRLLTCQLVNAQCTAPNFSLEGLGDYDPASGSLSVNDRNRAGLVVTGHNSTTFRPWSDSSGGPFFFGPGGMKTANNPCSTDADYCASQHDGKLTADGWSLDSDTWQGVRTYDGTVGQWNTPDAYAGDVHDPMSQKPYMWNRNNPYEYVDPSGFDNERLDQAIESVLLGGVESGLSRGLVEKALTQNVRAAATQNARLASNAEQGRALERAAQTNGAKTAVRYPNGGRGVPDRLTKTTIEEAKSGRYQANTNQLRGQQDYAAENGLEHILHVYDDIRLSGPLQQLLDQGKITPVTYPRPPMRIK